MLFNTDFEQNTEAAYYFDCLRVEFTHKEDNGCDGIDYYYKLVLADRDLPIANLAARFAQLFYYDTDTPGHKYCNSHTLYVTANGVLGMLVIHEGYNN